VHNYRTFTKHQSNTGKYLALIAWTEQIRILKNYIWGHEYQLILGIKR